MPASLRFAHSPPSRAAILLLAALAGQAQATVVLDTYGPNNTSPGIPWSVVKAYNLHQNLALRFSLSQTSSIDSILSSLQGDGNATFGIMSNALDRPSNTWLYSTNLLNPTQHSLLTPSNWILDAGTYWLTAYANERFSGNWQGGATNSPYSFTHIPMVWYASQGIDAPAARITVSAVPEPATYGMLLAGMLLVAGAARRRRN